MIVGGMLVSISLSMSLWRWTVSKAFDMSRATAMVLLGGFFWLKPCAIVLLMVWSAVVVECCALKPCCVWICGMLFVMCGSIIFSRVLAMGESSAIGL